MKNNKTKKIKGNSERPRISVFRSNKFIYVQLIDDSCGRTLLSCSSGEVEGKGNNMDRAMKTGKRLGELSIKKGIKFAVFDRGKYLYFGKIKALADGIRSAGVIF